MLSLGLTARWCSASAPDAPLVAGLRHHGGGLLVLLAPAPATRFFPTLFVAFVLIGLGAGTSFMPLLTIAMADVPARDAGLASGS